MRCRRRWGRWSSRSIWRPGLLQRFGRTDVGLRGSRAHPDADARFREIDTAARHDLAGLDEIVDRRTGHDDEVVGFPGGDAFLHVQRPGKDGRDLESRFLFEPGHQVAIGAGGLGRRALISAASAAPCSAGAVATAGG